MYHAAVDQRIRAFQLLAPTSSDLNDEKIYRIKYKDLRAFIMISMSCFDNWLADLRLTREKLEVFGKMGRSDPILTS
jgi:hypothetical protein